MIHRISESLLLRPADLKPLSDDFEVIGVFNPGAVRVHDEIILLAHVAEKPCEIRQGFIGAPRWEFDGSVVIDWMSEDQLEWEDPRVIRRKSDGYLRLTSISHLRVFRSQDGGKMNWVPGASLLPVSLMEEFGIEDPRITEIDGTYWITYVAVSRHGVATALASTRDFITFDRHGIVFYPENKDVVLFPQRIDGQYLALHRPNPRSHFGPPEIWVARSSNLRQWGRYECLIRGTSPWESDRIGAGTPPVLLEEGWLEIYHGSRRSQRAGEVGAYVAGALLLDRDDPTRILRRSHAPIMEPTRECERFGFVDNVIFPTALMQHGDMLRVYYGAADTCTGVVEFSQRELLGALH